MSNYSELSSAASALGLTPSRRMQGALDGAVRNSEREGWLADPDGDATPLKVVVFVSGRPVATAQTNGERPDETRLLGLAFGAEKKRRL